MNRSTRHNSGNPARRRSRGQTPRRPGGRKPAAAQGEFALPVNATPALPPAASFADLDMPPVLLTTLQHQGVSVPFPIQAATLPDSLAGRDVLGRGRTGSGKTLAFGLALLARTAGRRAAPRHPLALILVPTRELAQQVTEALTPYARAAHLRLATVVGGTSLARQAAALRDGSEVVVATPGRLRDLIDRRDCHLDQVRITVLDEADQMADMGFLPQVTALLRQVRADGQRMLFSATLDHNVDRLVRAFLTDPVVHSVDPSAATVTTMEHHVLHVADGDKRTAATHIAARDGRVLLFLHTKRGADRLARHLLSNGVKAAALHGGKSQSQRTRTLEQFKRGDITALVATNVAARGIHIDDLDLVVNVDPPADHKDYLHRSGRTARAGESGRVVTLVLPDQRHEMTRLTTTAGITAHTTRIQPGSTELARITGARTPSGVPVTLAAAAVSPVKRKNAGGGSGRRGGSALTQRASFRTRFPEKTTPRRAAA
ncbi:DEAD/DEAH box helicase [Streptomyces sp. NBC_01808]|uniref:DEAD/DEAH box helicase n=1 Tax=Streptomyces sp. NBC_01808 TaxID=2975947 RepID=UPI002DD8A509|nr:DEAD/DEAH box helicase [Streptomyces sp. NBC_01808]WSA39732.1 DEAD/DEAH box helicase [Streptomyces sp. NBC_01808]